MGEMPMKNLVNYAIKYANLGFSVLPMIGKQPLIKFADKQPLTPEEIIKIWRKKPYAQIALRTTNFFVVDIDRHEDGQNGFKSIDDYNHREYFRETLSQKTAGGGKQLLYLKREDMAVSQHIGWLPGVDIKAHPNNYIVVAPSEINGKCYEWLNRMPIATASPELVAAINKDTSNGYSLENLKFDDKKTATSELFEEIINGLGDTGGRNNALASFVGGLLFRNVDVKVAYQLALIANQNTPESLDIKEFDRTFESMVKKELRRREVG